AKKNNGDNILSYQIKRPCAPFSIAVGSILRRLLQIHPVVIVVFLLCLRFVYELKLLVSVLILLQQPPPIRVSDSREPIQPPADDGAVPPPPPQDLFLPEEVYVLSDDASRIFPMQPSQKRRESARSRRGVVVVSDEQFEYEEIRDDEFAGEDRWRRRRVGEESLDDSDKAFVASSETKGCLSASSEFQALDLEKEDSNL
ncbi:hypothetical protein HID58_089362, partial [Brassica napus]